MRWRGGDGIKLRGREEESLRGKRWRGGEMEKWRGVEKERLRGERWRCREVERRGKERCNNMQ